MEDYILIVDDDQEGCELMDYALESFGLHTRNALDGEQALRMIQEQRPSLVILDLLMPQMSGFAVLKHLHRNPDWKSIPVILVSSMVQSTEVSRATNVIGIIRKADLTLEALSRLLEEAGLLGKVTP